jgi:uncharacterized OB-fold protein
MYPVKTRCIECFAAAPEWTAASGRATLYTFGLMHQLYDPGFEGEIPYNIAIVELEEGVLMKTNVVECPNDALQIGMPLEVTFDRLTDEVALPKFRPRRG